MRMNTEPFFGLASGAVSSAEACPAAHGVHPMRDRRRRRPAELARVRGTGEVTLCGELAADFMVDKMRGEGVPLFGRTPRPAWPRLCRELGRGQLRPRSRVSTSNAIRARPRRGSLPQQNRTFSPLAAFSRGAKAPFRRALGCGPRCVPGVTPVRQLTEEIQLVGIDGILRLL